MDNIGKILFAILVIAVVLIAIYVALIAISISVIAGLFTGIAVGVTNCCQAFYNNVSIEIATS